MHYRMFVIFGHPVIAATRALRFADHVTKRNGGSGDENELQPRGERERERQAKDKEMSLLWGEAKLRLKHRIEQDRTQRKGIIDKAQLG